MSKPIQILPVGDKFMVKAYGYEVVRTEKGKLDVPRKIKGKMTHPVGQVAFFTQKEAETVAHQIGRYFFNLGDFVDAYCEGVKPYCNECQAQTHKQCVCDNYDKSP